jgi:hypothetical protein
VSTSTTQIIGSSIAFRTIRWACRLAGYTGIAAWSLYGSLLMSWAGRRPLRPDPPFTLPFQDHGTLFVSLSDLQFSHRLLLVSGVLVALGLITHWAERFWPEGRAAIAERKAEERNRWVQRQNARSWRDRRC